MEIENTENGLVRKIIITGILDSKQLRNATFYQDLEADMWEKHPETPHTWPLPYISCFPCY